MITKFDGTIDDEFHDLRQLLEKMQVIHQIESDRKWQVRCGKCKYLGPWAAAILAAAYKEGTRLKQEPKITLPKVPPALRAYCVFSGMDQLFAKGAAPQLDHPDCETIPLHSFQKASFDLPNGILKLIHRHMSPDDESEEGLRTAVQEVTQNVSDHSRSHIGGVMSARYMTKTQEIRVAIVDRGIGIGASLGKVYSQASTPFAALQMVTEGGFSSKSRPNNMGLGVSQLFSILINNRGRIAAVSGDAMATSHRGHPVQIEHLPFAFNGTGIFFALPLRAGTRPEYE